MRIWYKVVFLGGVAIFSLGVIFISQYIKFSDNKLHVVFCDVGQGDGIFIRTPQGSNIILDGGPSDAILSCISSHTPFWDRTIYLMLLTHPHEDHLYGLLSILERYSAIHFGSENLANKTTGFKKLDKLLKEKKLMTHFLYRGGKIKTRDGITLSIIGPSKTFLGSVSPNGIIGESGEFASLESYLRYGKFSILFTGDSQIEELENGIESSITLPVDILQVPHHGSKSGISQEILGKLKPRLCVISVGQNNRYGHPAAEIISLAESNNCKILRTDIQGEIEIITDGNKWWIRNIQ